MQSSWKGRLVSRIALTNATKPFQTLWFATSEPWILLCTIVDDPDIIGVVAECEDQDFPPQLIWQAIEWTLCNCFVDSWRCDILTYLAWVVGLLSGPEIF